MAQCRGSQELYSQRNGPMCRRSILVHVSSYKIDKNCALSLLVLHLYPSYIYLILLVALKAKGVFGLAYFMGLTAY